MNIIQLPQPLPPTPAQSVALAQLSYVNAAAYEAVARHKELYKSFWDSPAKPAEILVEMGNNASAWLASASASIQQIATLATIGGVTLTDLIAPEYYVPRMPLTAHNDGTVTIEQINGLDPWGRPIPQHVPTPDPE